jgi:hypothetical protein
LAVSRAVPRAVSWAVCLVERKAGSMADRLVVLWAAQKAAWRVAHSAVLTAVWKAVMTAERLAAWLAVCLVSKSAE